MDRTAFTQELEDRAKKNFPEEEIRIWEDGFQPTTEKEREFVESANALYAKKESDKLIGDFVTFCKDGASTRVSMECLASLADGTEHGWDMVMEAVRRSIQERDSFQGAENLQDILDYSRACSRLFIRLLNYQDHRLELKGMVYDRIGDMAKVLYYKLSDDGVNLNSTKVHADQIGEWGVSLDEAWDAAMLNTFSSAMPRIYRSVEECIDPPYQRGIFMDREFEIGSAGHIVLTTTRQLNGAIALFYPGVAARIAQLLGNDFLIAFTSIDDVRIHPVGSVSPREVLMRLKNVNRNFNESRGDILSRKVYKYSRDTGEITMLEL